MIKMDVRQSWRMVIFDPTNDDIYVVGRRVFTEFESGLRALPEWANARVKTGRAGIIRDGEPVAVSEIAGQYYYLTPSGAVDSDHANGDSDALLKLMAAEEKGAAANPSRRYDERRVEAAMWSADMRRDWALYDLFAEHFVQGRKDPRIRNGMHWEPVARHK
jgi:hypothetical protein